jgi:nicotinamide mononucleotide transporter
MTPALEIAANAITTMSIVLAGRNSIHTWWTGILGCLLFVAVFYFSQLYADVVLQVFFIATSVIGWRLWLRGDYGRPLAVGRASPVLMAWTVCVGAAMTLAYGAVLHTYTDAYAPFVDSAVLVFSVVGQVLMMQRRLECWLFWLAVDSIAVPLYASRGLHLTAVLYAFYWMVALVSFWHWRRLMLAQPAAAGTAA